MTKTKVDELRETLEKKKAAEATQAEVDIPEADAAVDTAEPETEGESFEDQLVSAQAQAQEHRDNMLRTMAEFENFRKRTEREKTEAIAFANERLLSDLMPILDHLDAALANVSDDMGDAGKALAEGVSLTLREWMNVLEKFGFAEAPAEPGAVFDPALHEAVSQITSDDVESGAIVTRHRRGYTLNGRVLRAALVVVAS